MFACLRPLEGKLFQARAVVVAIVVVYYVCLMVHYFVSIVTGMEEVLHKCLLHE